MILEVDGVKFGYNGKDILKNVQLNVDRGEMLVILGPNGVGKTTLLRCINAILKPKAGTIMVEGGDVLKMEPAAIARRVGYVAQYQAKTRMTAFDAILMGRKPHIRFRTSEDDIRMVDGAIKVLGLEDLAMRHIDEMSGGELQKVAVGRALVQEPRLMLLDEPTSSLDLKNTMNILSLIQRVVKEHNVGAVMTMHNLNSALRFADKFVFLKNGEIHSAGEIQEVSEEMIEEVYDIPVEILHHNGRPLVVPLN
ncbi:iron complex transport system ATP-binding protein [Desulfatibacillum alkenivorans DSM 16219]|jgi:iron complex transport system ATP-binding protein|uniref:Iron complex transport system ATP-binding protein n=1 Tax=Desulfatibacillum alkenivorans DSM 16219 TaxID=1121393 RepID=A0A1M6BM69_9BACT|nr:ABC transporter ATP-binding protein [Desulfatibacillum alkenivorans]SHI49593.1 iron complex transport system ATP-binding protein [Desulfatibacillum alkenivorans DSM 16219]